MSQAAYRIDGQLVDRAAFYAVACDPARSVAVEACAGAGKTWMLVSRILRALLEGTAPQDILAITFTKKAAGEMRARLQQELQRWAGLPDEELLDALTTRGMPPEAARLCLADARGLHDLSWLRRGGDALNDWDWTQSASRVLGAFIGLLAGANTGKQLVKLI